MLPLSGKPSAFDFEEAAGKGSEHSEFCTGVSSSESKLFEARSAKSESRRLCLGLVVIPAGLRAILPEVSEG